MLSLTVSQTSNQPLAEQIVAGIKRQIDDRPLRPGSKLPSIRSFAETYSVSRFTVVEAYDRLVAMGYLQSRRGNRLFELGLGPIALAFCAASSPAEQALIEGVMHANAPEAFAGKFLEARGLEWATALLDQHATERLEAAE